ncbi:MULTISPECIES: hypothetical protein [Nocardia]|uniref:hypothetical protein n=1 Tax=Nocardia TaxID=1817 RepID=UPI0024586E81|nr:MULTISPECIES: hypothetical protein [Nocardia]
MDTMEKVIALIKANPAHLAEATADFEHRHRADPSDVGIRRVYFALLGEFNSRYPIEQFRPAEVEPPEEAWTDEAHPFWTTDPFTVWEAKRRALAEQLGGWTAAHLHIFKNKGIPAEKA